MQLQLNKPELEKFIDAKVKSGDFPSPAAVVEDAVARMMMDEQSLSREDIAAINRAEEEMDQGRFVDFDVFAAEMRKKFSRP
jgi:Arc/MetJ-type ribon-helix-helix transcriptional regulator